ncbi:MAG: lectin-like protein [Bacteroidota bacterium]
MASSLLARGRAVLMAGLLLATAPAAMAQSYVYVSTGMAYADAEAHAASLGGTLPIITDAAENAAVFATIGDPAFHTWIGLNDRAAEGTFAWIDGTPVGYTNWGGNQPDNFNNEDCGMMLGVVTANVGAAGQWNDADCTAMLPFVVELPSLGVTLTGAEGYRMLAHPAGGTVDDLLGSIYTQGFPGSDEPSRSFCSIYTFDETAGTFEGGYSCIDGASDAIPRGTGVFAYVYEDDPITRPTEDEDGLPQLLTITGTGADAPFSAFTLPYTDGAMTPAYEEGWTILGNPFADGFDWDLVTRSINLRETIYVYDPNYFSGDFRSWTQNVGGDLTDGVVPMFQSFFVKSNTPGATLTVPTGAVVSPTPPVYGRDTANGSAETPASVRFELSTIADGTETPVSATFVTATEGAALGEDATDAYRLTPGAWPRTVLSTLTDTEAGESVPLVLNALPSDAEGEITVPVSVAAEGHAAGPLELAVSASGSLPDGWTAVLVDRETGTRTEVAPGMRYRFTAEVTEAAAKAGALRLGVPVGPFAARTATTTYDSGDRFALVVTPARIVSTESGGQPFALGAIAPNPTRGTASVALSLPEAGAVTVAVYDAMGRQVASVQQAAAAGSHRLGVPVAGLAPGIYVVRVESPSGTATRRLTVVR